MSNDVLSVTMMLAYRAEYESEFPNMNFARNMADTLYLNETVEFGFQCWLRSAKLRYKDSKAVCEGFTFTKQGQQLGIVDRRGPSEAMAGLMQYGGATQHPLYPHPPKVVDEDQLFDLTMRQLADDWNIIGISDAERKRCRMIWDVRSGYGSRAPVMPSLTTGMKVVLDYTYSDRAQVTGTSNWAAGIAKELYKSVMLANGLTTDPKEI